MHRKVRCTAVQFIRFGAPIRNSEFRLGSVQKLETTKWRPSNCQKCGNALFSQKTTMKRKVNYCVLHILSMLLDYHLLLLCLSINKGTTVLNQYTPVLWYWGSYGTAVGRFHLRTNESCEWSAIYFSVMTTVYYTCLDWQKDWCLFNYMNENNNRYMYGILLTLPLKLFTDIMQTYFIQIKTINTRYHRTPAYMFLLFSP